MRRTEEDMIEVTRLNEKKLTINAELIERVEETPDTVITLTTGNKLIVKESRQEIRNLVILYKKEVFSREL
jgi:flagellar protein FlbD